jgi:hypothetical protein
MTSTHDLGGNDIVVRHLRADPAARFTDLGSGWHDEQADRERKIRNTTSARSRPRPRRDRQSGCG